MNLVRTTLASSDIANVQQHPIKETKTRLIEITKNRHKKNGAMEKVHSTLCCDEIIPQAVYWQIGTKKQKQLNIAPQKGSNRAGQNIQQRGKQEQSGRHTSRDCILPTLNIIGNGAQISARRRLKIRSHKFLAEERTQQKDRRQKAGKAEDPSPVQTNEIQSAFDHDRRV